MLDQLQDDDHTSIINQGDAYIHRRNAKEALRFANMDTHKSLPDQIWYDSLRESDNGSYSKVDLSFDPVICKDAQNFNQHVRKYYFKPKVDQSKPFCSTARVYQQQLGKAISPTNPPL